MKIAKNAIFRIGEKTQSLSSIVECGLLGVNSCIILAMFLSCLSECTQLETLLLLPLELSPFFDLAAIFLLSLSWRL